MQGDPVPLISHTKSGAAKGYILIGSVITRAGSDKCHSIVVGDRPNGSLRMARARAIRL